MEEKIEYVKKWMVKVDHVYLSNGFTTEWFDLKECEVYDYGGDDEYIEEGDMLDDGSMYKGKIVNYSEFEDMISEEGEEVTDTSGEGYHILDSLESGREKFNELIKNTWSQE
tara:strand:+ start:462 stop:797 length:336 start_codon:yes stop_codon:yes gene_type:complete